MSDHARSARLLRRWLPAGLVVVLAVSVWLVYAPGLTASYYFDDGPNLAGLERVSDTRSALEFVLSGESGPSGRPLALGSFLLNAGDWPAHPDRLRRTNVLIHVINALLVMWLTIRLAASAGRNRNAAILVGSIAAAAWSLSPILASTTMMITQRMTSLSALFVLLGLLVFVIAHQRLDRFPRSALAAMSAGLVVFTLLATLCKENGALLPVYALASTLLLPAPPPRLSRTWRAWELLFLWLPLLAILAFLLSCLPWPTATALIRDFDARERLLTEAGVLWQYLFNAVLPMSKAQFGPFHDTVTASRSLFEPLTALALVAWLAAAWLAVTLRRRLPVLSFAIFWFLGGHLLESTLLPLELYFEHRNYLPLVGPAIGLGWLATGVPARWRRFSAIVTSAYIALLAWTTVAVTDEWGSPLRFAETQYRHHRESARAAGFFATHLLAIDRPQLALSILNQASTNVGDSLRLRLASLPIRCRAATGARVRIDVDALADSLVRAEADRNLARALHDLLQHAAAIGCPPLHASEMERLVDAIDSNPVIAAADESRYWIHRARALIAAKRGNHSRQVGQLRQALQAQFEPFALELLLRAHLRRGEAPAACEQLSDLVASDAVNPLRRWYIRLVIERMKREFGLADGGSRSCPAGHQDATPSPAGNKPEPAS